MEDMSLIYNIKLCRICQIPDNLDLVNTSVTTGKGAGTYLDILKYIFEDILWVEDQLISVVCKTCLSKITDIAEFKKICKETNDRRGLLNFNFIKHEDADVGVNDKKLQVNGSAKGVHTSLNEGNAKQSADASRKRKVIQLGHRQAKRKKTGEECDVSLNDIKIENSDSDPEFAPFAKVKAKADRSMLQKSVNIKKGIHKTDRTRTLGITCDICNISCISLAEHDRHVYNQHDGVRTHICAVCGKGYITKDDLTGHIKSVHADKEQFMFSCTECGAKFYKSSALQMHTTLHHSTSVIKFSCMVCGNKYSTKGNLRTHMFSHSVSKETRLKTDQEKINNAFDSNDDSHNELYNMLDTDSEDGNSRSTKSEEEKIMSIIQGEKKRRTKPHTINMREKQRQKRRNKTDRTRTLGITCDICKTPCVSLAERDRHVYSRHNGARTHICAICGRGYITKDDLSGHMKSVHADKQEFKFLCTECGAKFYKLSVLQKHTETRHKQLRKFSCAVCGRPFTTNGNLKSHMLTHTDIREYKCDLCPAEYKRKDVYLIHRTQKHGIGNYKCNRNLKEKNYACSMCEQRFNTRPRLLAHIRKHHTDVEPFCATAP